MNLMSPFQAIAASKLFLSRLCRSHGRLVDYEISVEPLDLGTVRMTVTYATGDTFSADCDVRPLIRLRDADCGRAN